MARKGENIYKRKDGRWEARYIKGYEPSGKIRYGFCYGRSYREAKEKALTMQTSLRSPAPSPPSLSTSRRRFARFCADWLQTVRGQVKESTYVKYGKILEKHILPQLGSLFPSAFSTQAVGRFRSALLEKGLAARTVRDILTVLRSVLKYTAQQFPGTFPAVEI